MASAPQARLTRLIPALPVDGIAYGAAVHLNNGPRDDYAGAAFVSATIARVSHVGGNAYDVWLLGAPQSCSTVKGTAPDTWQDTWRPTCGGNFCATAESMRVLDYSNDRAFRGPDTADRVIVGDSVRLVQGARRYPLAAVTLAQSYDAPIRVGGSPVVDWNPDSLTPENRRTVPELYDLTPTAPSGGTLFFDPSDALYTGCGVNYSMTDPPATGALARRVFEVSGQPDPYLYPDNAQFSGAEYWAHPQTLEVRIASAALAVADTLYLTYWERACNPMAYSAGYAAVIASTGESGTGYASLVDTVAASAESVGGDCDVVYTIQSGAGALEWRKTASAGAVRICLTWSAAGLLTGASVRQTADGAAASVDLSPSDFSLPFQVRVVKSGGDFEFYARQTSGDAWGLVASETIADVETDTDGMVSLTAWGGGAVRWSSASNSTRTLLAFAEGTQSAQRSVSSAIAAGYVTMPKIAGRALVAVVNETTGEAMTASATQGRGNYRNESDHLLFYIESNGDQLRATFAAPSEHPPRPGRPPLQRNQINAATLPEGGDGSVSTEDPDENHLNWQDRVRIEWEGPGEFPGIPGDTLEGVRRRVMADDPTLYYSLDATATWTALPGDAARVWRAEGLVLLTQAWIDSLDAGAVPWVRAVVPMVHGGGPMDAAATYNERRSALAGLDSGWIDAGYCSPGSIGCSGRAGPFVMGSAAFSCRSPGGGAPTEPYASDLVIGQRPRTNPEIGGLYPRPYGIWVLNGGSYYYEDTMLRTPHVVSTGVTCGLGGYNTGDAYVDGEGPLELAPEAVMTDQMLSGLTVFSVGPGDSWFGSSPVLTDPPGVGYAASFGFVAPLFSPTDRLRRLAGLGAVCIAAEIEATFEGLRIYNWTQSYDSDVATGDYDRQFVVNGVTVYRGTRVSGVETGETNAMPDGAASGSVTFSLVARRRNTANGLAWDGVTDTYYQVPIAAHEYRGFGSGIVTPVEDGVRKTVDCAGAINGLMEAMRQGYTDPALWPSAGGVDPGTDEGALAGYARNLLPADVEFETRDDHPTGVSFWSSYSGTFVVFSSMSLGTCLGQFRMPSGEAVTLCLPAKLPPFVRAPE